MVNYILSIFGFEDFTIAVNDKVSRNLIEIAFNFAPWFKAGFHALSYSLYSR